MRDVEQRLRWIEELIGGGQREAHRSNALVVPVANGNIAIAFSSIEEVVSSGKMKSLAFLPKEFSGVLSQGYELVPVLDVEACVSESSSQIVIVRSNDCLLGLRFSSDPYVIDLNELDHAPLKTESLQDAARAPLSLLDVDAMVSSLLAVG